ncbi:MAG: MBL fold metallo-hydrolase [Candidatus Pacebacteria bacterium]|nr:MBL fold metallo-hydrolase [Candidatus Paceibacterota bacterium]
MKKYLYIILIFLFLFNALAGIAFWQQKPIQTPRIIFLDIGQGDAALIDVGNDTQILIDGGDGKNILDKLGEHLPFYDRKIELVIMTHPDKDHLGGLVEVLRYYEVEQILETGIECDKAICEEWDRLIEEKNIPVTYAHFGQRIKASDINIAVLYPFENLEGKEVKNSNDASIVLKVVIKDGLFEAEKNGDKSKMILNQSFDNDQDDIVQNSNSFLLTGDAGFPVEKELLYKNINIEAKILKVSHHGSKHATSNEFLQAVNPEKAIVSVGKNSYGHPAKELLNRLKNMSIEIFRTDEAGDVIFE